MSSLRRRLVLVLGAFGAAGLAATAAQAEPPAERGRPELVGTYQRVAKDLVQPDGSLRDVYEDLLVTGGRSYRLTLPRGTHLHGGTPIRVRGRLTGADMAVQEVETLGEASVPETTGTTSVLVILAHWSSPDSVTQAQAQSQIFGDDDGWFEEASYGQLGLSGTTTPWVKIAAPTGGMCYSKHMEIMNNAKAKALTIGYDAANYERTIVYFPMCGGDASGAAGWAYQPGTEVWLNGYMDRRVSIHEMGHNYGLAHAHTYTCTVSSVRVTLAPASSCYHTEYGDEYDSMGGSNYAAHFSAPAKNDLAWLTGRKRTLTSAETTFTLPPFETAGAQPLAAVAGVAGTARSYWVEYRQAIGYDNALPSGATGGVLVHMKDSGISAGGGPFLLDVSPQNTYSDAVIPPGGAWTSPEGVRISVGAVSATGAVVTVKGGADPPVVPSVPLNVSALGGDGSVKVSWDPPTSNGGATIQDYVVTRQPGGTTQTVEGTTLTAGSLTNGVEYTFAVAARNAAGTGPASTPVPAIPNAQLPSVSVTAPANGATIGGLVTLSATASPHPVSLASIDGVSFEVDGQGVDWDSTAPYSVQWDSTWTDDGPHTITATAYDENNRYRTSAAVDVTVATPKPTVAITLPLDGTVTTDDVVTLQATAEPAAGGDAPIQWVSYELTDGTAIGYGGDTAPYAAEWDATMLNGGYDVVAKAYDTNGRSGTSAPVHVTFDHPVPSVSVTAPAEGATVLGSAVEVTAAATPSPVSNADISQVEFYLDGSTYLGSDYDAPYATTWDTGSLVGAHTLTAVAYDVNGRTATSATRSVTVANPVPTVAITSPADFAVVDGVVQLAATATPNAQSGSPIESVTFSVDGFPLDAIAAPGPYTVGWSGFTGQHTVVATAVDEAGRVGESATITFTVPPPEPSAVMVAPTNGATVNAGAFDLVVVGSPDPGTGSPVSFAQFVVDGETLEWDEAPDAGGVFTATWQATPGQHVISATVFDENFDSGETGVVSVTVIAKPGAPTGVSAAASTNGSATVSWTAPANDGGSAITGYVVKTGAVTKQAASSPFVFTGLANGTAYAFTVAAVNAAGTGAFSTVGNTVIPGSTALTRAVSPATVTYGKAVTVTGKLTVAGTTAPLPGRTVQLLACAPGSATCAYTGKSGITSATGAVSIAYTPKMHRDLKLRYVKTTDQFPTVTTTAVRAQVRAYVTSAISRTSMLLGGSATVSGKVAPAHSGKRAYLQRLYSTGWKNVTYKTLGTTGTVSFAVRPTARGTYTYRLAFLGDTDHLAGYSTARTVKVT
ncbi:MAG TPA: Ig-like domain-containing protein [Frankiaceae bacterium]|nr:Ig-like domain-containing protein [Frankiaceae bacterium]